MNLVLRNYIHLGDIINGFEFSIRNFETMKGEIII